MKSITLAIDEGTLEAGRRYASRHQTTLSSLVRELLVRTVLADRQALANEMFRLMDAILRGEAVDARRAVFPVGLFSTPTSLFMLRTPVAGK